MTLNGTMTFDRVTIGRAMIGMSMIGKPAIHLLS